MIQIRKARTRRDIQGIFALQKQNVKSPEHQDKNWSDGFVTLRHTPDLLHEMMKKSPQMVAISEEGLVGYNLSMLPHMHVMFPVLDPMMSAFEDIQVEGRRLTSFPYVIGGQCCIRKDYQGKGILSKLYHGTKNDLYEKCDFCVTEIARSNPRSLRAHEKFGFKIVHTYGTEDHIWDIVLWDWRN